MVYELKKPYDPTGMKVSNKLVENYSIIKNRGDDYYQFSFLHGATFQKNMKVVHVASGKELLYNIDYKLTYRLSYLSDHLETGVYYGFLLMNQEMEGMLKITSQIVGGQYMDYDRSLIPTLLETIDNLEETNWEEVVDEPEKFAVNALTHDIAAEDTVGYDAMVAGLDDVSDAILQLADPELIPDRGNKDVNNRGMTKINMGDASFMRLNGYIKIDLPRPEREALFSFKVEISSVVGQRNGEKTGGNMVISASGLITTTPLNNTQLWERYDIRIRDTNDDYDVYPVYMDSLPCLIIGPFYPIDDLSFTKDRTIVNVARMQYTNNPYDIDAFTASRTITSMETLPTGLDALEIDIKTDTDHLHDNLGINTLLRQEAGLTKEWYPRKASALFPGENVGQLRITLPVRVVTNETVTINIIGFGKRFKDNLNITLSARFNAETKDWEEVSLLGFNGISRIMIKAGNLVNGLYTIYLGTDATVWDNYSATINQVMVSTSNYDQWRLNDWKFDIIQSPFDDTIVFEKMLKQGNAEFNTVMLFNNLTDNNIPLPNN